MSSKITKNNLVKIAVQFEGKNAKFVTLDLNKSLSSFIFELCEDWELCNAEAYALKVLQRNGKFFVTESNKHEIRNGSILELDSSPSKACERILNIIENNSEDDFKICQHLMELSVFNSDSVFADEFINRNGVRILTEKLSNSDFNNEVTSHYLISLLNAMISLEHHSKCYDQLEISFCAKLLNIINDVENQRCNKILQFLLALFEYIISNSTNLSDEIENAVNINSLIFYLSNGMKDVQINALTFLNTLCSKANDDLKHRIHQALLSNNIYETINKNILNRYDTLENEMEYQLYVLQKFLLNTYKEKMNICVDQCSNEAYNNIKELRRIVFDTGTEQSDASPCKSINCAKDFKKLGFRNEKNPCLDFSQVPPGILALDNMIYFANKYPENYIRIVLENSYNDKHYELPFARASIAMTQLICDILKIGEPQHDQTEHFYLLFYTSKYPFEDFFCICMLLLSQSWKEMKATIEDFDKVFSVVKEQILRAFKLMPRSLDHFKDKLKTLNYGEIINLWQQERASKEENESQAKPIVELKEKLIPEILELIKQHRLQFLRDGSKFLKYSTKGQVVYNLPNKLEVQNIKGLITGRECIHMKDLRCKKNTFPLAFSVIFETIETSDNNSLDFIATDDIMYDYWTDGINILLGFPMVSKEANNDLETLMSIELKIRLLDVEGIDIPQEPPPIPPDSPKNFMY